MMMMLSLRLHWQPQAASEVEPRADSARVQPSSEGEPATGSASDSPAWESSGSESDSDSESDSAGPRPTGRWQESIDSLRPRASVNLQ